MSTRRRHVTQKSSKIIFGVKTVKLLCTICASFECTRKMPANYKFNNGYVPVHKGINNRSRSYEGTIFLAVTGIEIMAYNCAKIRYARGIRNSRRRSGNACFYVSLG